MSRDSQDEFDERKEGKGVSSSAAGGAPGGLRSVAAEKAAEYPVGLFHENELKATQGSVIVKQGGDALKKLYAAIHLQSASVRDELEPEIAAMGIAYREVVDAYLDKRQRMKVSN